MITDKDVEAMNARLDALLQEVRDLKQSVKCRYSWEEKATDSGIQIAGGPTTVTHTGVLKAVTSLPTPQGIAILFVLQDDASGKFAIMPPEMVTPL